MLHVRNTILGRPHSLNNWSTIEVQIYSPGPDTLDNVGSLIARRRNELDCSVSEIADLAGINRTTLYRLEAGKLGDVGVIKLERIWQALGLRSVLLVAPPNLDGARATEGSPNG
ncbi:helix-turn-helix domain-containing protein [Marinimicrobium sp. ABcell2]|uniref:helix-turn-helix domain-containing protein n=1 Tax=Marinimicrobium sp. ABcell2 TaxID=3069751 RepID=UPI0027B37335|nr:helix-turn-helix transcriptional regulator [Marinimicrobium sp. ABcell2]MDQ2077559.1 helix-turn-helix transcriptional regulator [Marinimicrobium sp. ABcell2]